MINFTINNQLITADETKTILTIAKENSIHIPTLCNYTDLGIHSECRVCVVEIDGQKGLSTACSTYPKEGMVVKTNSPRVTNSRKNTVELLLANHDASCTTCVRNMHCELQALANKLGIDERRFESVLDIQELDLSTPSIIRNPNRCIKCGRCVEVCRTVQGMSVLDFHGRGQAMTVGPAYHHQLADVFCAYCGQCANVCPVGAIMEKDQTSDVWEAIHDSSKHVIIQIAPAIRVSLGEELGFQVGEIVTGKMVSALKLMGFDKVFDTNFTADLTILEEGNELLKRIKDNGTLPMITSCCPAWINYLEHRYPEVIPNVSSCKSPQQMFGALAKSYYADKEGLAPEDIFVVSIMPCTAKKFEATRPEMSLNQKDPDVDISLTTRELGKMIRQMGIDFSHLEESEFDRPFGETTGAAALFGATGGVMEAALRTVVEALTEKPLDNLDFISLRGIDGFKEAEISIDGQILKVAVVHTLSNAKLICEQIKNGTSPYLFIEVMACPGGCVGGGGQPYGSTREQVGKRMAAIYDVDKHLAVRKSHENPSIVKLYSEYLKTPLGHLSHQLLHTHYTDKRE
jgi:NADH-quinone oxidoreductase subunit G/NADP-reducing hydrogenase subunit HndD